MTFEHLVPLLDEHMDRWASIDSEEGLRVFGEEYRIDLARIDAEGRLESFARAAGVSEPITYSVERIREGMDRGRPDGVSEY